ncbi:nitrate- and nitrite sensing domain-containing protein [Streptosporangiaceae bacterium NEAU-GS5]|nr:nitrate- and nitrite sensing domain-containing protein [Streptosporangiaceae bacterium NEAU-GS5]
MRRPLRTQDPRSEQGPVIAAQEAPGQEPSAGSALRLRNWRVRSRLIALILVPTLAALLLGGIRVVSSINTAGEFQRLNELAQLVGRVGGLTHELESERDRTAWWAAIARPDKGMNAVTQQVNRTDGAATGVRELATPLRDELGGRAGQEIENILGKLGGLEQLRKQAIQETLLPSAILNQYTLVIDDLLSLQDELGKNTQDEELGTLAVSLSALSHAKEAASIQRGLLATVIPAGTFEQTQLQTFLGAVSEQNAQLALFRKNATSAQRTTYDENVTGRKVDQAEFLRTLALDRANAGFPLNNLDETKADDAREWFEAASQPIDKMRDVETSIASGITARSDLLRSDEQTRAWLVAGAVVALLAAVLVITTGVARSLVRPLRRLRSEALEVAGHRLPDTVQRLRETGDLADTPPIIPIGVVSRDEVGEVARAFDEVHREAVRLAGDEARLRSNINAMFVNLSRRSQTLVERQLSLIEGLEQGEQDEHRLGNLFKLDHLATRMRRNSENLLVLAGQEPARRWGQPVPVVDVVRAALSEVENYERVQLAVQPGVAVLGQSVNDVVHLVAELVENAISFSPRETRVGVTSNRIDGGGLMVAVSDQGIGMTSDELAGANYRLANPPVVDVSVSRRMGLFVVGRLALRHGIRVQLRQQDTGGLTAMVLLPDSLLSQAGPAFPGVPGMPQPELAAGPMAYGTPQPALASPTPFQSLPPGPYFGADGPGPQSPNGGDPYDRPAFGSFPSMPVASGQNNPFDSGSFTGNPNSFTGESGAFPNYPFGPGGPMASGVFDRRSFESGAGTPYQTGGHLPPGGAFGGPFDQGQPGQPYGQPGGPQHGQQPGPFDRPPMPERDPFEAARFENGMLAPWPGQAGGAPQGGGGNNWPAAGQPGTGWPGAFGGPFESEIDRTGPLPVVRHSPMETAEEEYLPIFAAVESDWFRRAAPAEKKEDDDGEVSSPLEPKPWSSPADVGWQAAQAAADPSLGGITSSGLPKRVPKANLVPGSADPVLPQAPAAPVPHVSPDRVRSRLSSFQQGIRHGRAVARGEASEEDGYPGSPSGT